MKQQQAELKAEEKNIDEQKRLSMPNPQEIKFEAEPGDDPYFESNIPELKETLRSIVNDKRGASEYYSAVKVAAKKVLALDFRSFVNIDAAG